MTNRVRALHGALALIGVAMLVTLVVVAAVNTRSEAAVTRFESASLCIRPPMSTTLDRAGLRHLFSQAPAEDCFTSTVPLPHHSHPADIIVHRDHVLPLSIVWYRFQYTVPKGWSDNDDLMIYSPRVMGSAWQVRIDEVPVADDFDDWRMTWNRPLAATAVSRRFHAGDEVSIAIGVAVEPELGVALTRVRAGAANDVSLPFEIRQFLQLSLPVACSVVLLIMGAFFLGFWLLRGSERIHLILSCSCVAWCVFDLYFVLPRRDDATLDEWYSAVTGPSITWVMWLTYLFVTKLDARFSRRVAIALSVFVLVMSFVAIPWFPWRPAGVLYQGANVAVATLIFGYIFWTASRGGSVELRVIAAALVLGTLAGIHDWMLLSERIGPEGIYLLPYSGTLLFGAFLFAVQRRYVDALDQYERLSGSLAQRLAEREAELRANHSRLLELERVQTLTTERQRLMHDMHDGLGSALTASLSLLEQGSIDGEELKKVLRESADDLRAVIDSLEPLDSDLVSVLATLRYRLGRRLQSAGIEVVWEMQDLPRLAWLDAPQALQLIRIVQEVLTNVLKHASANQVRIGARSGDGFVEVCIADNGCGFDPAITPTGRGLRHLKQRATSLHGSIVIDSSVGAGTKVVMRLPVELPQLSSLARS